MESNVVRAAPGPGEGVTRAWLKSNIWDQMGKTWVIGFYGHHASKQYGCFSNFYEAPFKFVVPEEFCAFPLSEQQRTVDCDFSEKAIMVCKAAAMGDHKSYEKIKESKANPAAIKKMGRQVQRFNDDLWKNIECSVAYEVVYQKFLNVDSLKWVLLSTEDWVIAEATSNDANWGIGLDIGDERVHNPAQWKGTNLLGWALMEARKALRSGDIALTPPVASTAMCNSSVMADAKTEKVSSGFTEEEKSFLKIAKKCRAILTLEETRDAGETLDKTQMKKLDDKHTAFMELSDVQKHLSMESELRSRNEDVLVAMATYLSTVMQDA